MILARRALTLRRPFYLRETNFLPNRNCPNRDDGPSQHSPLDER